MSKSIYSKLANKASKEKERLEKAAENRGSYDKVDYYKPKTGDNMIRLIPNLNDVERSWITVKLHYLPFTTKEGKSVGVPFRCLADYEEAEKCPACTHSKRAYDEGDKKIGGELRARETHLYTVLDYTGKKIAPYTMPSKVHEEIVGYVNDMGPEAIFSLEEGRDWKLVKKVDPSKGKVFGTTYSIRPSVQESEIPAKFRAVAEEGFDLTSLYPDDKQDENKTRMLEFLTKMNGEETPEEEEEELPKKKTVKKVVEEEDEEEEELPKKKPTKKVVEEDEEEETPRFKKSSKKVVEEEEEEELPKKKTAKKVVEEEEEEELPKKKTAKKVVEEDDDDFEAPKSSKTKTKAKVEVDEDLEGELEGLLED